MNYDKLLDFSLELGYRLGMSGAETYRIEDTVNHIMRAYGVQAEVFAIPNCLHISIETPQGQAMTRMCRIGYHGNDLDAVEKYSNLSRKVCAEKPDPDVATQWLEKIENDRRYYPFLIYMLGNFLGGLGFCILFGGSGFDAIFSGACSLVIGLVNWVMDRLKVNQFFRIITASFLAALFAYFIGSMGITKNSDAVIIGALMILVPGLLFTNAMRDIIYGDTNSGINRIVQVFLIAAAIALGTAAAWNLAAVTFGIPASAVVVDHHLWVELISAFVACVGFFILFNIHGTGGFLCAFGGLLTWAAYRITIFVGGGDILAYFLGTVVAALYSEIMARIRKYPAISYLLISIFPLIPGAGIYYAVNFAVRGDISSFTDKLLHTIAVAGAMAVGILIVSTTVRTISDHIQKKKK